MVSLPHLQGVCLGYPHGVGLLLEVRNVVGLSLVEALIEVRNVGSNLGEVSYCTVNVRIDVDAESLLQVVWRSSCVYTF